MNVERRVELCVWRVLQDLGQMLFRGKAESKNRVRPTVSPLTKLLRCFSKVHVGSDCAVDDDLKKTTH